MKLSLNALRMSKYPVERYASYLLSLTMIGLFITALMQVALLLYMRIRKKMPFYTIAAVFFSAAGSVSVIIVLQYLVHSFLDSALAMQPSMVRRFFNSFIVAALVEECGKAFCFCLTAAVLSKKRRIGCRKEDTPTVGSTVTSDFYSHIMLALFFGLAFGGFENISYSLRYPAGQEIRLLAVILHGMLGSFYAAVLHARTKSSAVFFLCAAIILHGFYNFFIFLGGIFFLPAFAVLGMVFLYAKRIYCRR